jgi:DNA-binding NarL/FixJ family response regulator
VARHREAVPVGRAGVLDEVRARLAGELGRDVVLLGLARAKAALTAADDNARAAAADLAAALADHASHPYPLELARAWHALGGLERRAHRRAAARAALTEAIDRYAIIGATPWLAAARAELSRLDGATTAGLTASEQKIVDLLLAGATNREIAAATFLSVKAVEANLTRLYRRHGVRNRAQLITALGRLRRGASAGDDPVMVRDDQRVHRPWWSAPPESLP